MKKSQPDGTSPLPETAELGGEGGSFGDGASSESGRTPGTRPQPVDEPVTDIVGNATRLPEVAHESELPAGQGIRKHATEP